MRLVLGLAVSLLLTACSGGEINTNAIDVDRLPITDDGDVFLGRRIEW